MRSHWLLRASAWLLGLYTLACLIAGIALAELSLRLHKLPLGETQAIRTRLHITPQDVTLAAADGAQLKAWFLTPAQPNGRSVLILHGVTANRIVSAGFAQMFLAHGYSVLVPDSREHGESGGPIATYGILERNDVKLWTEWLRRRAPACTFLLGESMGAAIGLQAEAVSPNLCAVAVEDPYARFREISYERLGRGTRTGALFWRTLGRPVLEVAILYTRARYGLWLPDANPYAAVTHSTTPTLLITGTADINIPMHHAQELAAACPTHCTLWIVPGANHGGASTVAPAEFEQRILAFFEQHDAR